MVHKTKHKLKWMIDCIDNIYHAKLINFKFSYLDVSYKCRETMYIYSSTNIDKLKAKLDKIKNNFTLLELVFDSFYVCSLSGAGGTYSNIVLSFFDLNQVLDGFTDFQLLSYSVIPFKEIKPSKRGELQQMRVKPKKGVKRIQKTGGYLAANGKMKIRTHL